MELKKIRFDFLWNKKDSKTIKTTKIASENSSTITFKRKVGFFLGIFSPL